MIIKKYILLLLVLGFMSCGEDDYVPKPKAYLRLDYPAAKYANNEFDMPFTFEINELAPNIKYKKLTSSTESYAVNIGYPSLKATLYLTYKAIEDNEKNLFDFLRDAQKFTIEHTQRADEIPRFPYENSEQKVYGELSEVKGNVASPIQFYVTDSINHFLTGSLYFDVKTKYDSILPAVNYLQNDVEHIMETIKWK